APVLAARAAMRAGAGYVQLAAPSSLEDVLASRLVEPMTLAMPETPQRTLALAALEPLLEAAAAVDAVVLGCGLSRHSESSELVRRFVERCATPVLLDADGLNAFEAAREALHAESAAASPACGAPGRVRILTPHLGEMQRLTGESPAALESARIDGTVAWAKRWAAVLVLKGAPTVTASADGAATVNSTGGPVLASAGTGDVLAGITVALVAQGLAAYDAARLGVFLHGTAGDRLNTTRGALGVIASDVLEALPDVMRELARTREGRARGTA
ncbi:MAG: NAD(P)H-hydrate dehydratase, partial [Candidatus Eisenbacteria bacterium]|nr:NAD(P)H-hydrate dehydratase [Candidatus Eisenbacteria bacterium]